MGTNECRRNRKHNCPSLDIQVVLHYVCSVQLHHNHLLDIFVAVFANVILIYQELVSGSEFIDLENIEKTNLRIDLSYIVLY